MEGMICVAKLTNKQALFCKEYLVDLNATQAAIRSGYSEKTADRIGPENLCKLVVKEEIQRLQQIRAEKVNITAEDVLKDILDTRRACEENMILKTEFGDKLDSTAINGRNKANELLGKHLKLFTDKVEHSGEINIPQINIKRG